MKKVLYLLFAAALILASCKKEENPSPEGENQDKEEFVLDDYEATIKLTGSSTVDILSDEGATGTIVFACDHEWMIEIPEADQEWLSVNKKTGKSTKTTVVTFTAKANDGPSRSAQCRILSGSKKKKFTVRQAAKVLILKESDVPDLDRYYKPLEFNFDMFRSDSKWSWCRSKQSEHFVVFWDIKYGEYGLWGEQMGESNTWPTTCKTSSMAVDIDDLLAKAEEFYELNVNKLKFAETGKGLSVLDKYKMEIYLIYQSEWLATGSGYDNTIGALWVNPSTCKPVGSTIGHEIGHCFQYMVFCDYLVREGKGGDAAPSASGNQGPGWRYGFGANGEGGNCFWEQTAQWQSMQIEKYRMEAYYGWYAEFATSINLHVLHERPRYGNYFIHWWWVEENDDITFIGRLWNEAQYPEDPVETYMRMMGYDLDGMYDSMWQYAAHMVTYDTDELRNYGKNNHGDIATGRISSTDGGYWAISAEVAPESTGSNIIRMDIPSDGNVSVTMYPNLGVNGCVSGPLSKAGWRYGFVAINGTGIRTYSPVWSATEEAQEWKVPSGATNLWLVVTGAPKEYERHPWTDESDDKDTKWPWKARFEGTKPYGK